MQTTTGASRGWAVPFFTLWSGQALSLLGSRVAGFALVWWLTEQTGSAVVLTTLTLMLFLPQIVLGPFIGALIDRWPRRRVMLAADATTAVASALLALLFWADALQIWQIYLASFVGSLAGTFHFAAMTASTSLMVPSDQLTRVQGTNQMLQGLLTVAAPPLGALAVATLPFAVIMSIDVVTAAFAIGPLLWLTIPQPTGQPTVTDAPSPNLWREVRAGIAYIWQWPALLWLTLLAMGVNFMAGPIGALLPILVTKHFGGAALQLAWLELTLGVGMLAGGLLLGTWGGFQRRGLMFPVGLLGIGVASLGIGLTPPTLFSLALVGSFGFGVTTSLLNGTLMATLQATVDPAMQGRIFTVLNSGASAAMPIGLLIAGPLADRWGAPLWFTLSGVVISLVAGLAFALPTIFTLEAGQLGQAPSPLLPKSVV